MFDQYQAKSREKRDEWFYPTVIYAALTIVSAVSLTFYFSGATSIADLFFRGMKIEGEMSVITKDGRRVNLAGAKVCVVREEKITEWIDLKNERAVAESKKAKTDLAYARHAKLWADRDYKEATNSDERSKAAVFQSDKSAKYSKAEAEYRYWFSSEFYLNGLKECESKAVTDSDGKFSLTVRKGKYALAAEAERVAADTKEEYFWLLWVTPETSFKQVALGNDNLMTANPPEKVVEIQRLD